MGSFNRAKVAAAVVAAGIESVVSEAAKVVRRVMERGKEPTIALLYNRNSVWEDRDSGKRCTIWTDVVRCVYFFLFTSRGQPMSSNFQRHSLGPLWLLGYSGMSRKVGPRKERRCRTERAIERRRQGMGKWESVPRRHFIALYSPNTSPRIWSACR